MALILMLDRFWLAGRIRCGAWVCSRAWMPVISSVEWTWTPAAANSAASAYTWQSCSTRALNSSRLWNIVISNAKTFIDGTYHGRGRARRQLYLEEFIYRFNRRHLGTRIAERLLLACMTSKPHPYAT